MEKIIHLDTHVAVWLFGNKLDKFPRRALALISDCIPVISPAVLLEIQFLFEINRIIVPSEKIFSTLENEIGLRIAEASFPKVMHEALKHQWTRDPFDRMIVSTSAVEKHSLITKDETILKHYNRSIWE